MLSSSFWARAARTSFIRPTVRSGPLLGRSYVLLAAKPINNVLLRSAPLITRQQSSAATLRVENSTLPPVIEPAETEQLPQFASLHDVMDPRLLRALTDTSGPFKLKTMSPVQAAVLPLLTELTQSYDPENPPTSPRDLMVRARTGTGKTLAFLIPAVEARLKVLDEVAKKSVHDAGLKPNDRLVNSARDRYASTHAGTVIISPTRELATQIAKEAMKLTKYLSHIQVHSLVGGESKQQQLRALSKGTHDIIVATPGRIRDILDSSAWVADSIAKAQTLILDEGDTLLDMGFQPDILAIQKAMPQSPARQTFLFSATLSPAVRGVARAVLAKEHRYINCVSDDAPPTHAHIPQYHTILPSAKHQFSHVFRLLAHDQLSNPGKSKIVVFLPTTMMTQLFAELLTQIKRDALPAGHNTRVYELHSRKNMSQRVRASDAFRSDQSGTSVLVTSDVSARGVDYPGVTRVIQVGIPASTDMYVHRVGRTGRAGTQGRGDLVLLPFERDYVSSQMSDFALKPLTFDGLASQVVDLAKTHDADPKAFFGGEIPDATPTRKGGSRSYLQSRPLFSSSTLAPMIEDIPRVAAELISQADPEAIDSTFVSLLGYYVGLTADLKVRKTDILEACKEWAVEACGAPEPHVSSKMMERLGMGNDRKMDRIRKSGFREPRQNSWASRGQSRVREEFKYDERARRDGGGFERRGGSMERGGGGDRGFGRRDWQRSGRGDERSSFGGRHSERGRGGYNGGGSWNRLGGEF